MRYLLLALVLLVTQAQLGAATAPMVWSSWGEGLIGTGEVKLRLSGVSYDAQSGALTFVVTVPPKNGSLRLGPVQKTSTYIYQADAFYAPNPGYSGKDAFTFVAKDGNGLQSAPATGSITIKLPNQPPVARDQAFDTSPGVALINRLDVQDPDSYSMGITILRQPAHGTLTVSYQDFTYVAAAGYSGSDSFTYTANDGSADSNPATVSFSVRLATDRRGQTIEVIAQEQIYGQLRDEIDRLRDDLTAEGYTARVVTWPAASSVTDLWNHLHGEYVKPGQRLTGAILVGNLPIPNTGPQNDLVYWNMDECQHGTTAYVAKFHIWVSRIISIATKFGTERDLIKRALDANHAYRTRRSRLPHTVYVYDAFGTEYPTSSKAAYAQNYLAIWPKVETRIEADDGQNKMQFTTRTDLRTGADALTLGGELFDECSHGNGGCYMNGGVGTTDIYRFIAQQRFMLDESCSQAAVGNILNQHILTRGGGMLWCVGGSVINYVHDFGLADTYDRDRTQVRSRIAQGESWGYAFVKSYPFGATNRTLFYGDLSLSPKMSPANALPVISSFTSQVASGSQVTFTVSFSDPDMAGAQNPELDYRHRIEWFPEGYVQGTRQPASVTRLNGTTTATYAHTYARPGRYTTRVEVADAWGAIAWKELQLDVGGTPVAVNDAATVAADATVMIPVLVNDSDPGGGSLSLADIAVRPTHGTAVVSGAAVVYTPANRSYTGSDTFTYGVTNAFGLRSTATVTVTITGDVTPPTLVSAQSIGDPAKVSLVFSEPITKASAELAAHHALDGGIAVTGAALSTDGRTVTLSVNPALVYGRTYTVTVNDVLDTAVPANRIAQDARISFVAFGRFQGLSWDAFDVTSAVVPDFSSLTPVRRGTSLGIDLGVRHRDTNVAVHYHGQIRIDTAGTYTFYLTSDDRSQLTINGAVVIDNTAAAMTERTGTAKLAVGYHDLRLGYTQLGGAMGLELRWEGPGIAKALVPISQFFRYDNTPPSISAIADQVIDEDTASALIPFTVADPQSAATTLRVTASSANTGLVPAVGLNLAGSGSDRTLRITPARDASGVATITVRVTDGIAAATRTCTVTVRPVNDPPRCTTPPAMSGTFVAGQVITGLPGTWNDTADGGSIARLYLWQWQRSSNLDGSGAVDIPGATESTYRLGDADVDQVIRVRVTAADATGLQASAVSDVSTQVVQDGSLPPSILCAGTLTVGEDQTSAAANITVSDAETTSDQLVLSASTADAELIPASGITLAGTGSTRTIRVKPAANRSGAAQITVSVSDGVMRSDCVLAVTVVPVNDPPVNTERPVITGPFRVGGSLSATTGTWNDTLDGGAIAGYAYQWQRATSAGGSGVADIAGATGAGYTPVAADQGRFLRVRVTATDAGVPAPGVSAVAYSAYTAAISAATPGATCDVNRDGRIDILDLVAVRQRFGSADADCDLNRDGAVDVVDLVEVRKGFGN